MYVGFAIGKILSNKFGFLQRPEETKTLHHTKFVKISEKTRHLPISHSIQRLHCIRSHIFIINLSEIMDSIKRQNNFPVKSNRREKTTIFKAHFYFTIQKKSLIMIKPTGSFILINIFKLTKPTISQLQNCQLFGLLVVFFFFFIFLVNFRGISDTFDGRNNFKRK